MHLVVCLFLLLGSIFVTWFYHKIFTHFYVNRHLDYIQFSILVYSAVVDILVQNYLQAWDFIDFEYTPRVEFQRQMYTFIIDSQTFFPKRVEYLNFHQSVWEIWLLCILANIYYLQVFKLYSFWWVYIHLILIYTFLIIMLNTFLMFIRHLYMILSKVYKFFDQCC